MRKLVTGYDNQHRELVPEHSIVRYEDGSWMFHGAWLDTDTGKIKVLLSSPRTGKMRLVHDRHRREIELERTVVD